MVVCWIKPGKAKEMKESRGKTALLAVVRAPAPRPVPFFMEKTVRGGTRGGSS